MPCHAVKVFNAIYKPRSCSLTRYCPSNTRQWSYDTCRKTETVVRSVASRCQPSRDRPSRPAHFFVEIFFLPLIQEELSVARRASCQLLAEELALNTGKLP